MKRFYFYVNADNYRNNIFNNNVLKNIIRRLFVALKPLIYTKKS